MPSRLWPIAGWTEPDLNDQLFWLFFMEGTAGHASCEGRDTGRLRHHKGIVRRRSAFVMTNTELKDIARAATAGLSRMPKAG